MYNTEGQIILQTSVFGNVNCFGTLSTELNLLIFQWTKQLYYTEVTEKNLNSSRYSEIWDWRSLVEIAGF